MKLSASNLWDPADFQRVPAVELHAHTSYTDGESSVLMMIDDAINNDLSVLGFAEHLNATSNYWEAFIQDITVYQKEYINKIKILCGVEVKVKDYNGNLDFPVSFDPERVYIVGVVHSYPELEGNEHHRSTIDYELAALLEYKALEGLIISGNSDIIGHIGGTYQAKFKSAIFPRILRRKLLGLAKEMNTVVEFNARHHPDVNEWIEDLQWSGVLVALGSDAHTRSEVGKAYNIIKGLKK